MASNSRTPLLPSRVPANFQCPGCGTSLNSPSIPTPVYLRCTRCTTVFIANPSALKTRMIIWLLLGSIFLAASIGLTVWSYSAAGQDGGVYYVWWGGMAAGVVCIIRACVGFYRLNALKSPRSRSGLGPEFQVASAGNVPALQAFVAQGFDVNTKSRDGITCLQYAASKGQLEAVRFLLFSRADPNIASNASCPLLEATVNGHVEVLDELIRAGANENVTSMTTLPNGTMVQSSPLILASVRGHEHVIRYLLQCGHNPNILYQGSNPPLLCATKGGFVSVIRLLVGAGADINIRSVLGNTALHIAVLQNKPDALRTLLELGANPSLPNNKGQLPRALVDMNKNPTLARLFDEIAPPPAYEASPLTKEINA